MSNWTDLAGFPRTLASSCAPWVSTARIVNGQVETRDGKTVVLSGARAFLQRLESDLIERYRTSRDVPAALEVHAKHFDAVEWCRARAARRSTSRSGRGPAR